MTPGPTAKPLHGDALVNQTKGFPRVVLFRTAIESMAQRGEPRSRVTALAANYDMVIANCLGEYILGNTKVIPYLQDIKVRYPDKIVLVQFLVEGKNPLAPKPPIYAGHWLLLNGTMPTADILPSDNIIQVADSGVLREGEDVQITVLDASGRPDYTKVEQVRVTNLAPGRITVERGAYGSTPLGFKAGQTRIAAHAYAQYGINKVWLFNFSLESPRDNEGRRLSEVLAQYLSSQLSTGGLLEGLDGYQFDVASFFPLPVNQGTRRVDVDNDGKPDDGFVNGVNSFGLGALAFMKTLRGLVGEDILLLSEATGWYSNRDIADSNGIENESFPDLHHWDLFSSAYQRYRYWLENARSPRFSYLQLKESTEAFSKRPDEDRGTNWKYRLTMGASLLETGYFAYIPANWEEHPERGYVDRVTGSQYAELDEFKAGTDNKWNYLGKALEEPRRLDLLGGAKNLLPNGTFDNNLSGVTLTPTGQAQATTTLDQGQATQGQASLRISINRLDPAPGDYKVQVEIGNFAVQAGKEYTLRLRVRADLKYNSIDPIYAGVPRRVVIALNVPGVLSSQWVLQDVMADLQWREYWLSFIAPADSSNASIVVLLGREGGDVWLDDLRLQQGPGDVFVRRFEHGAVLVNASTGPVVFDLKTLFPDVTFRRISGTQDPSVNNGLSVGPSVTIPGRDAFILLTVEGG